MKTPARVAKTPPKKVAVEGAVLEPVVAVAPVAEGGVVVMVQEEEGSSFVVCIAVLIVIVGILAYYFNIHHTLKL